MKGLSCNWELPAVIPVPCRRNIMFSVKPTVTLPYWVKPPISSIPRRNPYYRKKKINKKKRRDIYSEFNNILHGGFARLSICNPRTVQSLQITPSSRLEREWPKKKVGRDLSQILWLLNWMGNRFPPN